jgi:hypothetical protein
LFDDPPAQRHSPTSVAAAEAIRPATGRLRMAVLEYLRSCGQNGATDDEMQDALNGTLGMGPSTQRPRRIELVEAGLVADSGRTRLTKAGRKAVVWVARETT